MELSANAIEVLKHRYLSENEKPEDMFSRMARLAASVEADEELWYNDFYKMLLNLDFVANTPCMINAGKSNQLSACFVLPVHDNIESIFNTLRDAALVHKSGGGTGFDFSELRPENSIVKSSNGLSSGPVSFMKVYNAATMEMKQGGVRRGANMAVLRVDHPDIIKFIECKNNEGDLSNFNISVGITNEFMECLENSNKYNFNLRFNGDIVSKINPVEIWNKIIEGAHKNGEPGIIFIDKMNYQNPLHSIETICSTNPCGEQPLPPYGSCNLGHINLSNFWNTKNKDMDWPKLKGTIDIAVRFLDNNIEAGTYPLTQIEEEAKSKRRIGLGIMGLADIFLKAGYRYGANDSRALAVKIMRFIKENAYLYSEYLGRQKGFYGKIENKLPDQSVHKDRKTLNSTNDNVLFGLPARRNSVMLTIAPTGSCSIIADCSSGCEPVFSFNFDKKCLDGNLKIVHPLAKKYLYNDKKLPDHFVTAKDVTMNEHILMQSDLQKYVDASISKTINAPFECSLNEISDAFKLAYEKGCKSLTFYREGSRESEAHTKEENNNIKLNSFVPEASSLESGYGDGEIFLATESENQIPLFAKRPQRLAGCTHKIETGRGKLYVTINEDTTGLPIEVFAKIGKSGKEDFAYTEALGRIISLALRWGVPVSALWKHLEGITGDDTRWYDGKLIKSVPDAIAKILDREYQIIKKISNKPEQDESMIKSSEIFPTTGPGTYSMKCYPLYMQSIRNITDYAGEVKSNRLDCVECGGKMESIGGCVSCVVCGFNKCGG